MIEHPQGTADLLITGGTIVTQDRDRKIIADGAIAVVDGAIVDVGDRSDIAARWQAAERLDASGCVVVPGAIDAHHHLTADPLVRSAIPDGISSDEAIFEWATPIHAGLTAEDDELSSLLTAVECLRYGTTTVIEAGTVAHPHAVAGAMLRAGIRGTVGRWGWDTEGLPFAAPAGEVLALQSELVEAYPPGGMVEGWATLVGHDLASDDLLEGVAALAREKGCGLTFHLSPTEADVDGYRKRSGLRPAEHLNKIGVLGPHLLLAHAVWIDEAELELLLDTRTAVAYCPWAYLRLAQGVTRAGRHAAMIRRGGRVALGCDSVNAGDIGDMYRAAVLAVGLARDMEMDPRSVTAATGLDLITIRGAEAVGMADRIGSIEIGKRADIVLHDTRVPSWRPAGRPDLNLIWGTDGRSVRDVVVDGRIVVRDGRSTLIDEDELAARAAEVSARILRAR